MRASWRLIVLGALVIAASVAIAVGLRRGAASPPPVRLTWIATANQFGPVGYRDPVGAISPDGRWLAFSEGRFLRIQPVAGGPIAEFPPGDGQIRHLAWMADSRRVLANGFRHETPWAVYERVGRSVQPLWPGRERLAADGGATAVVADVRQPAFSPDGRSLAAIVDGRDGVELWIAATDGSGARVQRMAHAASWPAWTARGEVACIMTIDGHSRVTVPCGGAAVHTVPDADAYGPIAFPPGGVTMFVAFANDAGTVDLWRAPLAGGAADRLTAFARDSYAPSVAADGSVVFKVQSYHTTVAVVPAEGGAAEPLATFQSETPSWDPTGRSLGITYGTWRRVPDDARYPDIAQETGIIAADPQQPAARPARVVHASASEDQSLCWSPNQKWIAFHSHKDQSDDIWLRRADGDAPARRVSFLGRGAETGWPRWSPDGRWILFDGASRQSHRQALHVVGVDQESGETTSSAREVEVRGVDAEPSHGEWLAGSETIVAIGKEGPGAQVIYTVARTGGDAHVVGRIASEHDAAGLAVSPDGHDVAFVAPAPDGFFQIFRQPLAGGERVQVTLDRTNKTQPAWSPDGRRLALTVWEYAAQFWTARW